MAPFNPQISGTPSTNFVNASQGRPANRAFETLFSGLSEAVLTGKELKDVKQTKALATEVQTNVDQIGNAILGSPDETLLGDPDKKYPEGEGPPELTAAGKQMQRMKQAFDTGKMTDVNYVTQVNLLAKRLRLKYPDQIDKIDDLLANATGTSTANQLRRALNTAWEAEASTATAAEKEKNKFLNEVLEKGYVNDPVIKGNYERITGKPFSVGDFNEKAMRFAVGVRASQDAERERWRQGLQDEDLTGKTVASRAKKAAIGEAGIIRDQMITASSSTLNALRTQMQQAQDAKSPGGSTITPEEKQALEAIMGRTELELNSAYDSLVHGIDKEGNSYASLIGNEKDMEEVKNTIMGPFSVIKSALLNEQTGVLGAVERDNKAKTIYRENKTLQDGDFTSALSAAKSIYGDQRVNDILNQLTTAGNDLTKLGPEDSAVAQKIMMMLMGGSSPSEVFKTAITNGDISNPATVMKIITTDISQLSSPDTTKEAKADILKRWFRQGEQNFLQQFNGQSAQQVFDTLTSPSVVEAVKGTEYADDYFDWVRRQADVILAPAANQIWNTQKFGDVSNITYNTSTKRFEVAPVPGVASGSLWEGYKSMKGTEAVNTFNRYLDKLQPIADDLGENLDATIAGFFTGRDYRKIQKQGSLMSNLADRFFEAIRSDTQDTSGTVPKQKSGKIDGSANKLLDFIQKAEGGDVNTLFGGGQADLASKTVGEVLQMKPVKGSSAKGSFQVLNKTLQSLVDSGEIDLEEQFTPETQRRVGLALLNRRGYKKWLKGEWNNSQFADSLAQEWASLPTSSGQSYYAGDGLNKNTVTRDELIGLLEGL